jgi:cyanate permease
MVPVTSYATTFGLANSVWFTGAMLSPWLTGKLKDLTGSFAWGLYAAAGLLVIGMVLVQGVRPPTAVKSRGMPPLNRSS